MCIRDRNCTVQWQKCPVQWFKPIALDSFSKFHRNLQHNNIAKLIAMRPRPRYYSNTQKSDLKNVISEVQFHSDNKIQISEIKSMKQVFTKYKPLLPRPWILNFEFYFISGYSIKPVTASSKYKIYRLQVRYIQRIDNRQDKRRQK